MDARLRSIERRVGRAVLSGGVFRFRYERSSRGGPGPSIIAGIAEAALWIVRRRRSGAPNYLVLATTVDTLFVVGADVATDAIGDDILVAPLDMLSASRRGTWDVDVCSGAATLRLTCVSCDSSSLDLIHQLVDPASSRI